MGMNMILSIIMGIAMTVIIGSQVAPSMIEKVKATKVEAKAINNQEVIFEAVKRYITMKQTNPTSLQDIIGEQFLNAKVNDNGFGGGYSIEIDGSKGLLKIKTTIEDPKAQEIFLNSFKNKFIPTRVGTTNEFETTFVIPTDIMHGRGLFMTGIPVQATPPTDTSLKYWYDTSGKEVALRMYDPNSNSWKKVAGTGGSGSISEGALVDASGNNFTKDTLPTTDAEVGEIKYAYDSTTNSIQEYVYTGIEKGWVIKSGENYFIIKSNDTRHWSNNTYATSCLGYIKSGTNKFQYRGEIGDGVYRIDPDGIGIIAPFDVYCDMTTDGGGWTLVYYGVPEIATTKANIVDSSFNDCLLDSDYLTKCNQRAWRNIKIQGYSYLKRLIPSKEWVVVEFKENMDWIKLGFISRTSNLFKHSYRISNPALKTLGYSIDYSVESGCQETAERPDLYAFAIGVSNTPCGDSNAFYYYPIDNYPYAGEYNKGVIFVR